MYESMKTVISISRYEGAKMVKRRAEECFNKLHTHRGMVWLYLLVE